MRTKLATLLAVGLLLATGSVAHAGGTGSDDHGNERQFEQLQDIRFIIDDKHCRGG